MRFRFEAVLVVILVSLVIGVIGSDIYHRNKYKETQAEINSLKETIAAREVSLQKLRDKSEEEIGILRGMIDSSATIITEKEMEIEFLKGEAVEQDQEIKDLLTGDVQRLINSSPPLSRYVLALNNQIKTKSDIIFTLEQRDAERVRIIEAQGKQIQLEREIGLTWKRQFEDQLALRIAVESSLAHYRRYSSRSKLLWTAGALAVGLLGGALLD